MLCQRIRDSLVDRGELVEGSFLGGKSFWLDDRFAIALHGEDVLVKVPDSEYRTLMDRSAARPYEFAARPVPNWVLYAGDAVDDDALAELVQLGLAAST